MNIKNVIRDNYYIEPKEVKKNGDSTDGNVYIINSDKKYVLKIYDSEIHANSMVLLHDYLLNKEFHVPKIIKTKDNKGCLKNEDKIFVIYSFLEGSQLNEFKKIPDEIIVKVSKELRRFHDNTSTNEYNFDNLCFGNIKSKRLSVLHFDLTKDNIFYTNDKIGFIDFDDAKYGPSICDVAIIISFLFISKSRGMDKEGLNLFIDSYYGEDLELKREEIVLIPDYVRKWIEYLMDGHEFDTSTKESFKVKKKLIEENYNIFI